MSLVGWDVDILLDKKVSWCNWLNTLSSLEKFCYPQCLWPHKFIPVTYALHCFYDASTIGYSAVVYLQTIDINGLVYVSFVTSNSKVAPLKPVTVPRLELVAAVNEIDIVQFNRRETDSSISCVLYWTNSTSEIKYIFNKTKRYHVSVANKISQVYEISNPSQWKYFFFFFFRLFPSIRNSHSVSCFSKAFSFQYPFPSHQLSPYFLSLHLEIFSSASLFCSFPVTPFSSPFFLRTPGFS